LASVLEGLSSIFFKILIPLMPLFVAGTALKLQHDGLISSIFDRYFPVLLVFVASSYGLVLLQFFLLSGGSISKTAHRIRNIIPALVTAFGSMSSAAALPLSIKAAEQNVHNVENARIIAPSTVNIHLVGDCFFIPMIAVAVMTSFGMSAPSIGAYVIFALHFVIAKFAVAAVPGGGVLVMLPIMQNYLGLSSDMLALVTALYILFDPLITTCNVAGNGTMAIAFDKVVGLLKPRFSRDVESVVR
jgi:Na+/H+-dicarboxylate symporter